MIVTTFSTGTKGLEFWKGRGLLNWAIPGKKETPPAADRSDFSQNHVNYIRSTNHVPNYDNN